MFGLVLPEGRGPGLAAGGVAGREGDLAWWDSKPGFLRALIALCRPPGPPALPSSLNFRFRQTRPPRARTPAGPGSLMATTLAGSVFLGEEQIFSLDWKSDKTVR